MQKELAALRGTLAEKDKALAKSDEQIQQLRANVATVSAKGQADADAAAQAQKKKNGEADALRQQAERQAVELAQARAQLKEAAREAEEQKQKKEAEARLLREQMREEGLIRQGKALREQLVSTDNTALVGSLNDVGLVMLSEGKLDQAEEMFRRALLILDQTGERASAASGTVLQHLADVAWSKNDLESAALFYEKAAQQFSSALGATHPRHAAALNGWARVRRDQQRPEEAEELYRMAIHIYERGAEQNPADLVAPLHNLGLLLMEQGRLEEAGPLLERAALLVEKSGQKKDDGRTLVVTRTLARYYRAAGDADKAAQFEEKANQLAVDTLVE